MEGVRDERGGFAREADVGAKLDGESFGCERGEEIPFDVVQEVEGCDLDVNLWVTLALERL